MRGLVGAFWVAVAGAGALYAAMAAWTLPAIAAAAGGLAPFDLRPLGYGEAEARAFLAALSPEGRALYLGAQHRLDLLYPPALALALALGFAVLARGRWRAALVALAVAGAAFDLLENRAVAALLGADPGAVPGALVAAASRWTVLKSGATALAEGALLGLAVAAWVRRRRGRALAPGARMR